MTSNKGNNSVCEASGRHRHISLGGDKSMNKTKRTLNWRSPNRKDKLDHAIAIHDNSDRSFSQRSWLIIWQYRVEMID